MGTGFSSPPPQPMKKLIQLLLLSIILVSCTPAQASWFGGSDLNIKLGNLEHQLKIQQGKTHELSQIACFLGIACVLFFIVGTAIGAKTRHDATQPTA